MDPAAQMGLDGFSAGALRSQTRDVLAAERLDTSEGGGWEIGGVGVAICEGNRSEEEERETGQQEQWQASVA